VLRLAERWSLDPSRLSVLSVVPATGWVARVPAAWRTERVKRLAA
jgi:hypothetical protein